MATPRIYFPQDLTIEQTVTLPPDAAHHLLTVLRIKGGESVLLFNNEAEFLAAIEVTGKKSATLTIIEKTANQPESALPLNLSVCLYRGKQLDISIQKAVELGVHQITPIISHKSDVIQNKTAAEKRQKHLQKIIIAACEQSGRIRPPKLNAEIHLQTWMEQAASNMAIACDFSKMTLDWKSRPDDGKTISLLICPAGGFTAEESHSFTAANIPNLNLGPRILRSDTATTIALGLLQHHWGDL